MMNMWLVMTLLRLVVPLTIFRFPFVGGILSIIADSIDWKLLPLHTSADFALYQQWDKLLDLYYLSFEAYIVFSWRSVLLKKIGIGLFLYRLLGEFLFEITHIRWLLFVFPNLFENFYLFVMGYEFVTKKTCRFVSVKNLVFVLVILLIPKLAQEYFLHVSQELPWQIINLNKILHSHSELFYYLNQTLWLFVYLSLPVSVFFLKIKKESLLPPQKAL